MAQETSRILSDGNVQAIDTSLNGKLKDTTGRGILAALVAYFTAAKNAIIGRLKLQDVATIESASTASKAYATGDFLAKDGNLYKATDDIAQDGTLNVGTNLEAAKLADEVSQLNSALVPQALVPTDVSNDVSVLRNSSYRIGKIAIIFVNLTVSQAISSTKALMKFPAALSQSSLTTVQMAMPLNSSGSSASNILLFISKNGALRLETTTPISAGADISASGCYVIDD